MLARRLTSVVLALACLAPLTAPAADRPVAVDVRVAASGPDAVTLLWSLDLADRWHVYGPFRNDTGFPPTFDLDLPAGWSVDLAGWPVPERYVLEGGILDHVYHGQLRLVQTIRPPSGAARRDAAATVRWLACRDICVPGDTTLTVALGAPVDPDAAAALAGVLQALPGPLAPELVQTTRDADRVEIAVPGARSLTFIPDATGPLPVDLATDGTASGERIAIRLRPEAGARTPVQGLLIIDHNNGDQIAGTIAIK